MTTFRVPRSCSGPGASPGVSTRPVRAGTGRPGIEPGSSHTVSRNRLQPGLSRGGARPEALLRTDSATLKEDRPVTTWDDRTELPPGTASAENELPPESGRSRDAR